jgi:hypothetical protein
VDDETVSRTYLTFTFEDGDGNDQLVDGLLLGGIMHRERLVFTRRGELGCTCTLIRLSNL